MTGSTGWSSPNSRTSPTTPTTVAHGVRGETRLIRLPSASPFGKTVRAKASFTTTAGGALAVSPPSMRRPLSRGMRRVSKKPGVTNRVCSECASVPGPTGCPSTS